MWWNEMRELNEWNTVGKAMTNTNDKYKEKG